MSAHPLASRLVDFSMPRRAASLEIVRPPAPSLDVEALIAQARTEARAEGFAAGRNKGRDEAARDAEARLGEAEARAAQGLGQARAEWAEAEGAAFAARIADGLDALRDEVSNHAARVLAQALAGIRRSHLVDEVLEGLAPALRERDAVTVEASGPADLLDALERRLPEGVALRRGAENGPDIALRIDRTTFETRLGAWLAALDQALDRT